MGRKRILIENCRIVDGSGNTWRRGSVAIRGTRIESIDHLEGRRSAERVDGDGLVLAPGLIDPHIHTDTVLFNEPVHIASLYQGVTTHIVGQDGFGFAPTNDETFQFMRWYTAGINGSEISLMPGGIYDYLARFDNAAAVNVAMLIPNGCVRMEVMGNSARAATRAQLDKMADLCRAGMAEGALGLSSGLDYVPSCYASTSELVHLASVVADLGGVYVTHLRYRLSLLGGLKEALEIGARARIPIHVSHLRGESGVGSNELLRLVDAARAKGIDVTYDVYPYVCGCTFLPYLIPSWVFSGRIDDVTSRLRDPSVRARVRDELEGVLPTWSSIKLAGDLSGERARYVGLDLATASGVAGCDPVSFACDLLLKEGFRVTLILCPTDAPAAETDLLHMLRHPAHMVGSDGIFTNGLLHPRGYGSFARFIGTLVREGLLPLEEAVRHATAATAARFGLSDRGLIRPGFAADLVLFDPDSLSDRATYEHGAAPAEGVREVFVNGVRVLEDGRPTGATPGQALRRGGSVLPMRG